MDIRMQSLLIRNFKGTSELKIEFDGHNAKIYGDNGTGKTSLYDAFMWVLFGKDSQGKASFSLKPTVNGEEQHNLEHTVSLALAVDGLSYEFTRTMTEKYVKGTFTGHETKFWVNDVPKKAGEYSAKVADIVDEKIFMWLTNADSFLSQKKPDIRATLLKMSGADINAHLNTEDEDINFLLNECFKRNVTPEEIKSTATTRLSLYKKETDGIVPRIDEVKRSMPAYQDWEALQQMIDQEKQEISDLTVKINNAKYNDNSVERSELLNQRNQIKSALLNSLNQTMTDLNTERRTLTKQYENVYSEIRAAEAQLISLPTIESLQAQIDGHRTEFNRIQKLINDAKDRSSATCKECGQTLPEGKLEEIKKETIKGLVYLSNAEVTESHRIKALVEQVTPIREKNTALIEELNPKREQIDYDIIKIDKKIESFTASFKTVEETESIKEIDLKLSTLNDGPAVDTSTAEEYLHIVKKALEVHQAELAKKDQIEKSNARIAEIQARARELASLSAAEQRIKDAYDKYMRLQAEAVTDKINSMFKYIKFRLFDIQINGGLVDDCTPTVNGVDLYLGASRSERIRAGLDIINALQASYGVTGPVFVDNSESATWLLPMNCQLIQMFVSEQDKTLRCEVER